MVARVFVTLKPGVLDPAGKAVEGSLHAPRLRRGRRVSGSASTSSCRSPTADAAEARARVEEMCRKLLANTVVENFRVEIG